MRRPERRRRLGWGFKQRPQGIIPDCRQPERAWMEEGEDG